MCFWGIVIWNEPGQLGFFSQYAQLETISLFTAGSQGQEEKEWHMCLHSQRLKYLADLTCIWIVHYPRYIFLLQIWIFQTPILYVCWFLIGFRYIILAVCKSMTYFSLICHLIDQCVRWVQGEMSLETLQISNGILLWVPPWLEAQLLQSYFDTQYSLQHSVKSSH